MSAVLRSDLRTRVRSAANMESSTFVTDTELNTWLDGAARRLYNKLVAQRGQEYYRLSYDIPTVASGANYDLPTNFWQLLAVTVNDGGTYVRMLPFEVGEIPDLLNIRNPTPSAIRYRLSGREYSGSSTLVDLIELCPVPTSVFTIRVDYIPTLALQVVGGGAGEVQYNGVQGWEEWMVLDAAIKCLIKEESDISGLAMQKAEIEADIQSLAGARDAGAGARVVDVRGGLGVSPWGLPPRWGGRL